MEHDRKHESLLARELCLLFFCFSPTPLVFQLEPRKTLYLFYFILFFDRVADIFFTGPNIFWVGTVYIFKELVLLEKRSFSNFSVMFSSVLQAYTFARCSSTKCTTLQMSKISDSNSVSKISYRSMHVCSLPDSSARTWCTLSFFQCIRFLSHPLGLDHPYRWETDIKKRIPNVLGLVGDKTCAYVGVFWNVL